MENNCKYKTKQQEIILNYLKQNMNKHITAEEIVEYLRKNEKKVGQTTVYRYLDVLVNSGEVRKYIIEENAASCFQYIGENKKCVEHYHLKCEKCGKLIHIECDLFKKIEKNLKQDYGFKLNNIKTVLYGICKECQVKEK